MSAELITLLIIAGIANFAISFPSLSVARGFTFFCSFNFLSLLIFSPIIHGFLFDFHHTAIIKDGACYGLRPLKIFCYLLFNIHGSRFQSPVSYPYPPDEPVHLPDAFLLLLL